MGVIPQGTSITTDTASIRKMKYCVDRMAGPWRCIPHGCLSNEGRPGGYAVPGRGKTGQAAGRTRRGAENRRRISHASQDGPKRPGAAGLETTVKPILTADEVKSLDSKDDLSPNDGRDRL